MTINSIEFLLFFCAVFFFYYFPLKEKTHGQNILLLLASAVFYGLANWKMIPLLVLVTLSFYALGISIGRSCEHAPRRAAVLTALGVCLGVGLLLYCKYLNFFIGSFNRVCSALGLHTNWGTFNILVPLGISFYTFKLISYVLEVYRQRIEPVTDIIAFGVYAVFFPTILAGPIDRPNTFIPQVQSKRPFDYLLAVDGCRQILWGMFKKMVIADNMALAVDSAWANISEMPGLSLLIAAFCYSIQLYADFSGYSDMAIGVGKLLGFKITRNFNYPFFGRNTAEYWRNWHISLTSWFTDYVFMPLNMRFRQSGKWGTIAAIIINFVLVGLWHGANWTFVVFGLYHGLLYVPLILSGAFTKRHKVHVSAFGLPLFKDFAAMLGTFILVSFGNLLFRAPSIGQAFEYMRNILQSPVPFSVSAIQGKKAILGSVGLLLWEWYSRNRCYAMPDVIIKSKPMRLLFYSIVFLSICFLNSSENVEFIYFQF